MQETLDKQYGIKRLVLAERHRFYSYKKGKTQPLSEYVSELWRLALTCDWNQAQLADNLHDKFVMGLYNERLLQQLVKQNKNNNNNNIMNNKNINKMANFSFLTITHASFFSLDT